MRMRQWLIGGLVAGTLTLMTIGGASAADLSYTPSTITYGMHGTTKVTGLTPKTAYALQIYNPWGVPLIPGGYPVTADASGAFTTADLDPDQTDMPGQYLFEVTTLDGKVVARATPTLVGVNTWYVQHRLGS
jgi:hypothetical protein